MTTADLIRHGSMAAVAAGVLGITGDLYHLTQERVETSALFRLHGVVLIAALICAVLALIGLQLRQSNDRPAPGGIGFWLAFAGTILVAGDVYYEFAVQPRLAEAAPAFLNGDPKGSHLLVILVAYALFGAGWLLTGISIARSKLFGVAPGVVLAIGGVIGFTPLPGSYVLWSVGLLLVGFAAVRSNTAEGRSSRASVTA